MTKEQIAEIHRLNEQQFRASLAARDAEDTAMRARAALDDYLRSLAEPAKRKYTRKAKNIEEIIK